MIEISSIVLLELKRKRGERNITVTTLSEETGISRWTLADILAGRKRIIKKSTYQKIDNWIAENSEE
ncbi:helix-turn-helix domain-containing protein [Leuconostoc mesenteroides]|uniref:helix-turn-helix domain-containing protein n=1 Tax=Leuconostoc mesenteroides TaxID=1245 RepID=UPI001CBE632E|nr:helix-turn-helix transcriptional regulator [Leuconostoc mesenteroides]MBZ1532030.1 helix-turn-helix domain-containing protein [Leuconostoc mesenteroides]